MFGRSVKVDGKEYWVWCTPHTPHHEILERAAKMARKEDSRVRYFGEPA